MTTIGVIGLGAMGLPMAKTLTHAGFRVIGFDADPARRALFRPSVNEIAALRDATTVVLSLPNDAVVEAVVHDLIGVLTRGAVIIDTSTIGPDTARTCQAKAAAAGIGYVDAPVSGGTAGAAEGTLLVMVGGEEEDIAQAEPVVNALARKVARCGGPGAGAVVKLTNNMLCAGHLILAGEVLRMAKAAGVDPATLFDALNGGTGRSGVTELNVPRWILSDAFDSGFTLGLMAKDVTLAEALPGAGPVAADVARTFREAADAMGRDADFNRVVERPS